MRMTYRLSHCSQTTGSQATAVENVFYGSMDVSPRRLEGTDVLRGVEETHIIQLLRGK